jgi:hypothetical protein
MNKRFTKKFRCDLPCARAPGETGPGHRKKRPVEKPASKENLPAERRGQKDIQSMAVARSDEKRH